MINHMGFVCFIKNMMINHNIEINGKRIVNCYIKDFKVKIVYEDGDFIQIKIKNKCGVADKKAAVENKKMTGTIMNYEGG